MAITPIAAQFPSTTTAHLTTLYTTLPVGEHGLYEWNVYEPALDAVILPLPFVHARREDGPVGLPPRELAPGRPLFGRLAAAGTPCTAPQPAPIAQSRSGSAGLRGAAVVAFAGSREGGAGRARALGGPGSTCPHWGGVGYARRRAGPSSG